MRRFLKFSAMALVSIATIALVVQAAVSRTASGDWPCSNHMSVSGHAPIEESAEKEPEDAARMGLMDVRALTDTLSPEEYERAQASIDSKDGPDRFDVGTGELYVNGELFATIAIERLGDGTYFATSVTTCAPAPPSSDPKLTPSDDAIESDGATG